MLHSRTPPTSEVLAKKKSKLKSLFHCLRVLCQDFVEKKRMTQALLISEHTHCCGWTFVVSHPSYNLDLSSVLLRKRARA